MTKIALVTGGNSGIGFETAKKLIERGYRVYISGRDQERVTKSAARLGAQPLIANMAVQSEVESLVAPFEETGLDALVNNAAIARFVPVGSYTEATFEDHFRTNVWGPLFLIQAALPSLESRRGCVTNVSSVITRRGAPGFATYAATKGAIEALTRVLALELASRHVRVNAICPGAIDTPIFSKMGIPPEALEVAAQEMQAKIPLSRFGRPEEVAEVIVHQLESSYTTGSIWEVGGGVTA